MNEQVQPQNGNAPLPLNIPDHVPHETKSEVFARLAEPRVTRAIDAVRLVGNLSNRGRYDYDPVDVDAIMTAMRQALNDVETRFRVSSPRGEGFKLHRR